jgi:hypothetical protein
MWAREDRSGGPVGLIIRSFVDAMSFFARVCMLGVNKSEGSEMVLRVKCLLGSDAVLH